MKKHRRIASAGIAIGLLGGGAAGFALGLPGVSSAQTGGTTTTPSPTATKYETKLRDTLKPLVDNGTLTQAQVDAVVGALKSAAPTKGEHHDGSRVANLSTAASAIGVTTDELRTALASGQSMADVAKSKNVDPQTVIDALVAESKKRLTDAVTAGKLTQAKADQLATEAQARITDMVNGVKSPKAHGHSDGRSRKSTPQETQPPTTQTPPTTK